MSRTYHSKLVSFDEFANVHSTPVSAENEKLIRKGCGTFRPDEFSRDWYGGATSQAEITGYLTNGWIAGASKLTGLVESMPELPAATSRRRKPTWADNGDDLNIDRALRGEWDTAWRTSRRVRTLGTTTIDVIALCGGNGTRSAEELFWSGASAVVICDLLESAGYQVRLTAASVCEVVGTRSAGEGSYVAHVVTMKESHEPLRVDIVASILCHAGVFRTHMFHSRMTHPVYMGEGMGATRGWTDPEVWGAVKVVMPESTEAVKLDHTYSREDCIAQITKTIGKLNARVVRD